jgi:hypothetical protein
MEPKMFSKVLKASTVAIGCVVISGFVGNITYAQQDSNGKAQEPAVVSGEPQQVGRGSSKEAGGRPATGPAGPEARPLFMRTLSPGKTCCAPCEEIASNGTCKIWGQCTGVKTCPAWSIN